MLYIFVYFDKDAGATGKFEYRFVGTSDEALAIYDKLCQTYMDAPNVYVKTKSYLGRNVGSQIFQQVSLFGTILMFETEL